MKLLEVVRGEKTAKDVLATVMALAKKIRKTAVVSGVCDGFIGNRMIEQYSRQAGFLLEEGCTPEQVDKAIEKFGFAMGPFRMGDLAGNDIGWAIRKRRYVEKPHMRYSKTADLLCEMGRFGQKTGAGWYDYQPASATRSRRELVDDMIARHRSELGITPRKIGDDEIVHRLVYALVNEGAKILEEGIASKASDIDMVYLTGYGFPLHRGGPMCYADEQGLFNVVQAMKRFAANPRDDARVLAAGAAAGQAGRRRQDVHLTSLEGLDTMTNAVIVSTARTPLAKSWKGAFNMTHGATLGGHVVKAAVERAGIDPAAVEDVLMGCANPEGATGWNIARQIALRAGLPVTRPGMTVNRFCSSGLQTIAMAAQRIIAGEGEVYVAGGVESISCVQKEMNMHMFEDPALDAEQARDLLEHAADRRAGGQALRRLASERMDRLRRREPAEGLRGAGRAGCSTPRSRRSP